MIRLSARWRWVLGLLAIAGMAALASLFWPTQQRRARLQRDRQGNLAFQNPGPHVVRGPYLQSLTATSVVVRWRTDVPTNSAIALSHQGPYHADAGAAPAAETSASAVTTEHEVLLDDLQAATEYTYSLGADVKVYPGSATQWAFRTGPLRSDPTAKVRVWALGDAGTASEGARGVRNAYLRYTQGQLPDVWLMLGDNAYNTGTDEEFQAAVFDTYHEILPRLSLWPTRGNHDQTQPSGRVAYFDNFTLPEAGQAGGAPSRTESYYAFDYGPVHFICLDSYATPRQATAAMATWVVEDLKQSTATWKVAYFHHPPYTRGTHNSDQERTMIEMRTNLVPLLEAGGVDLVLSGHSHSYERSGLMSGFYGPSTTFDARYKRASGGKGKAFHKRAGSRTGTIYVVAGASGELGRWFMGLDHPAMDVSFPVLGSLSLEFERDTATVRYVDVNAEVADAFTLVKHP